MHGNASMINLPFNCSCSQYRFIIFFIARLAYVHFEKKARPEGALWRQSTDEKQSELEQKQG